MKLFVEGVIPLTAAFVAQKYGSARQALKRLYKAGDPARQEFAKRVTEGHARQTDEIVEKDKVGNEISHFLR